MFNNYVIEYLGTFFFVFILLSTESPLKVSIAIAIAILLGSYISSATFFNPLIPIIMAMANKFPIYAIIPYIVSETAGAFTALYVYTHLIVNKK